MSLFAPSLRASRENSLIIFFGPHDGIGAANGQWYNGYGMHGHHEPYELPPPPNVGHKRRQCSPKRR